MKTLALYHQLPPPARSLAASARGLQLLLRRYGPETDRLAAEAAERERWSLARWESWREERLAHVMERAAKRVPYYRDRRPPNGNWRRLENWPLLLLGLLA